MSQYDHMMIGGLPEAYAQSIKSWLERSGIAVRLGLQQGGWNVYVPLEAPPKIVELVRLFVSGYQCADEIYNSGIPRGKAYWMGKSIDELELSVRASNILHTAGIRRIEDLTSKKRSDLLKLQGSGKKIVKHIEEELMRTCQLALKPR